MNLSFRDLPRAMTIYIAVIFSLMFLFAALPRLFYQYDLDLAEDGILMQAWQFAQGLPVFVPPNADFVPLQNTPFYSWLGGLIIRATGPDFLPLRLVSFISVVATALMVYYITLREAGEKWIALASAGLFIGGYRVTGFWYDLARVDSLYIALSLLGITLAIYARGRAGLMFASASVLALAFYTKQTALVFGLGIALLLLFQYGRRGFWYVLPFTGLIAIPLYLLNTSSNGWFWFYAFTLSSGDPIELGRVANFFTLELFGGMIGPAGCLVGFTYIAVRKASNVRLSILVRDRPWLFAILTGIVASAIGRASTGANLNDLMPAYTLLCLTPALLLREWSAALDAFSEAPVTIGTVELMVALSILFQFSVGAYNPLRYVPNSEMVASGNRLIQRIKAIEGNVNVMMHPYYALRAGKQPSAQFANVWYAYKRGGMPMPGDLVARLNSKYYAALVSDDSVFESDPAIVALIDANYTRGEILEPSESPPTVTGLVLRPTFVYHPKP